MARYDKIGMGYDLTRKADPYLVLRMIHHLRTEGEEHVYLDIGCGTGNYTAALHEYGLNLIGIDPSDEMLNKAEAKCSTITWQKGTAENINLNTESIAGVLASLTIHHWQNLNQGCKEIHRVLKKEGKFVLFTSLPSQINFPNMIADSAKVLSSFEKIKRAFNYANLEIIIQERYFIQPDLEDWFLYCGKHQPELYLRKEIRNGISSFSMIAHQGEVTEGLNKLREDIDTGEVNKIMKEFENDLGDYLFIIGNKG